MGELLHAFYLALFHLATLACPPDGNPGQVFERAGVGTTDPHEKVHTKRASSVESISFGKYPIGKRAAVQGRPFALVRAYAATTHQES